MGLGQTPTNTANTANRIQRKFPLRGPRLRQPPRQGRLVLMVKSVAQSRPRVPGIGKGGHQVRGTANQRRAMYEEFRKHTEEVREVLIEILRDEEADNSHRIQAGKEILNRGWGAAPQVSVIEAVFSQEVSINTDSLKQMSSEELKTMEGFLARLISPEGVEDAQVIDHEDSPS